MPCEMSSLNYGKMLKAKLYDCMTKEEEYDEGRGRFEE